MSRYAVCPKCEGEGFLPPAGCFVVASSDYDEEDNYRFASDYLAGAYNRGCDCCKGKRVVLSEVAHEMILLKQEVDIADY